MGDKLRLMVTGAAAAGVLAVAVSGNTIWSLFDDGDHSVPSRATDMAALRDFDGIRLEGPDNVVVTSGPEFSVKAEGSREALKYVTLAVRGNVLQVGRHDRNGWWGAAGRPATIRVTMPGLSRVWITGSGHVTADKVASPEFSSRLEGSGGVKIAELQSNEVHLSMEGSGQIELAGATRALTAELTGSGSVKLDALNAQTANVEVTGSGEIIARATNNASLAITGSGHAQVNGTTRCDIHKAGSGDAECTP